MNHQELFTRLAPLLRHGGGVGVVTNGVPLWLQDTAWSAALRSFLERWLDTKLTDRCGTDDESQLRYRDSLNAAGYEVTAHLIDYTEELSLNQIVGGIFSALSVDQLPAPNQRFRFAAQIGRAIRRHLPFTEYVPVRVLIGRMP